MPLPARPLLYQCPACGWRHVVTPVGDVLLGEPAACPICGHRPLATQSASLLHTMLNRLLAHRRP
jgi:DNA-directed RNA polymerase subunit RPC12/RpoP